MMFCSGCRFVRLVNWPLRGGAPKRASSDVTAGVTWRCSGHMFFVCGYSAVSFPMRRVLLFQSQTRLQGNKKIPWCRLAG